MKIFISHKFTGANKDQLKIKIEIISAILENRGHKSLVHWRDKQGWKVKKEKPLKVIKEAFSEVKKCDALLALVDNKEKSEGMLLEIGFAKALNKKIILVIDKKYPTTFLEALADKVIKFSNFKEAENKLGKI